MVSGFDPTNNLTLLVHLWAEVSLKVGQDPQQRSWGRDGFVVLECQSWNCELLNRLNNLNHYGWGSLLTSRDEANDGHTLQDDTEGVLVEDASRREKPLECFRHIDTNVSQVKVQGPQGVFHGNARQTGHQAERWSTDRSQSHFTVW